MLACSGIKGEGGAQHAIEHRSPCSMHSMSAPADAAADAFLPLVYSPLPCLKAPQRSRAMRCSHLSLTTALFAAAICVLDVLGGGAPTQLILFDILLGNFLASKYGQQVAFSSCLRAAATLQGTFPRPQWNCFRHNPAFSQGLAGSVGLPTDSLKNAQPHIYILIHLCVLTGEASAHQLCHPS